MLTRSYMTPAVTDASEVGATKDVQLSTLICALILRQHKKDIWSGLTS